MAVVRVAQMTLHLEPGPALAGVRCVAIVETRTAANGSAKGIWGSGSKKPIALALVSETSLTVWSLSDAAPANLAARISQQLAQ